MGFDTIEINLVRSSVIRILKNHTKIQRYHGKVQGALAHRPQSRPRLIHNNAKSGAYLNWPPLDFNVAKDTF